MLVPQSLREAADALGVSRWRTVLGMVLPTARWRHPHGDRPAVARAAGETAPLILVSSMFKQRHRSTHSAGDAEHPRVDIPGLRSRPIPPATHAPGGGARTRWP